MGHTHRYQIGFKKKKNQVMSPSPEFRVPKTGSDPPIGSDRDSGRDTPPTIGWSTWSNLLKTYIIWYGSLQTAPAPALE